MATVTQFPSSEVFVIEKGISQLFLQSGLKDDKKTGCIAGWQLSGKFNKLSVN